MLLVQRRCDSRVLLLRRPQHGIWGGLWTFPECATTAGLSAALATYELQAASLQHLAPIRHSFTHFLLIIHPLRVQVDTVSHLPDGGDIMWHALSAPTPAVPAPVGRLLINLGELS